MRAELFLIPNPVSEDRLAGRTIIMIDILRASTTICQSLQSGARAVIPVERPGEAAELRTKIGIEDTILGGERHGLKIENFDLGNSPMEYTSDRVKGKVVILTTSNGTQAYARAGASQLIITGALVNISKVVKKVAEAGQDLVIICAGDDGDFSIEDTLCGGMLLHKLITEENIKLDLNDAASLATLLYRTNSRSLKKTIARGEHGRLLTEIGFGHDVDTATETDTIPVLPVFRERRIVLDEN
jgi:2-phosphosulfolactate phosphatase